MTDDLKERLRQPLAMSMFLRSDDMYAEMESQRKEAIARITDLEARLAAAVAVQDRLMSERYQHYLRAEAAEAGEDALAECLRRLLTGDSYRAHSEAALAAYEARRG